MLSFRFQRLVKLSLSLLLAVFLPASAQTTVRLEEVASGFTYPVFVTGAGDGSGRLFVVERLGKIRIITPEGVVLPEPFLDLSSSGLDRVESSFSLGDERGLLGLAFHPDYENNGRFFVHYSLKDPSGGRTGDTVIAEYTVSADPNIANPTEKVILTQSQPATNHNGGMIAFNPFDSCEGCLYIGLGDGGGANDTFGNGQNLNTLLGSILRIDVDSGDPYGIPLDNPFVGVPGADEIFAYGLRNPWRFSFDRNNGRLFVGDVGQNTYEEVDLVHAGDNLGWNIMEGLHCFPPPGDSCDQTGLVLPIAEYDHSFGVSITGGYLYRGNAIPALQGAYVFGDFGSGRIWSLRQDPATFDWMQPVQIYQTEFRISSFGEDDEGEIYVVEFPPQSAPTTGKIHRLVSAASPTVTPTSSQTATATSSPTFTGTPSATTPPTPSPTGTPTPVSADLDNNGVVDGADLLEMIRQWKNTDESRQ